MSRKLDNLSRLWRDDKQGGQRCCSRFFVIPTTGGIYYTAGGIYYRCLASSTPCLDFGEMTNRANSVAVPASLSFRRQEESIIQQEESIIDVSQARQLVSTLAR